VQYKAWPKLRRALANAAVIQEVIEERLVILPLEPVGAVAAGLTAVFPSDV
jgi:hypothetical protein